MYEIALETVTKLFQENESRLDIDTFELIEMAENLLRKDFYELSEQDMLKIIRLAAADVLNCVVVN